MVIEVLKGAFNAKPGGVMRVKDIDEIRNKEANFVCVCAREEG